MVEYKGKNFDVDEDGVAVIVTPGIPVATTRQIKSKRLDKVIEQLAKRKPRLEDAVARAQQRLDETTAAETALIELRATVTAEPSHGNDND